MISGLSKAIMLYLTPLLSTTALILIMFAYLAPVLLLQGQVSLLAVYPSNVDFDGPTVVMGSLGSCSRPNNEASFRCTTATLSPTYDLSVLPSSAPDLLSAPAATTPVFIAISIAFLIMFVIVYTLITFSEKLGTKLKAMVTKPFFVRTVAWTGLLGFMIGLTSFLVIRMWFGKAVDDFNQQISDEGSGAPQLTAAIRNGFIMIWVAYAFLAVPLVSALARLHVMLPAGGGKA